MTIQKIKSGRINTVEADNYVGEHGIIFYNENLGDLRLSDGHTVGGVPLNVGSGGGPGAIGTIAVGTVTTGTNASVVNTGTVANAVLNFVLPQGPQGIPGTQITRLIDIPDVNRTNLANGSLLVYDSTGQQWNTTNDLPASSNIDAGEF